MAQYEYRWHTVKGQRMRERVQISMPDTVSRWLRDAFTNTRMRYHNRIKSRFSVDEALGAITTPSQYLALKTAQEVAELRSYHINTTVEFESGASLEFPAGVLCPRNGVAQSAFSNNLTARPDVRARIFEELSFQGEALLPWIKASIAFEGMAGLITEPAQVAHYMPWLAQCNVDRASYSGTPPERLRWHGAIIEALQSRKPPKTYIPLSPEQKEYLSAGNTALATWGLIEDQEVGDNTSLAVLWLDGKTPNDIPNPWED